MKIGILGSGVVATTIGTKLISLGHEVRLGSRNATNEKATAWAAAAGSRASHGTFSDAAAYGTMLFNCTSGSASLAALAAAGEANLAGKVLVDVANPLDFSRGFPPSLTVCNTDSLGEQIQRAHPEVRVVKALNTMNTMVMVDPGRVRGAHDAFVCGNDAKAKAEVTALLTGGFGWTSVTDLGDISNARGTEMLLPIWLRLYGAYGNGDFNFHIQRG